MNTSEMFSSLTKEYSFFMEHVANKPHVFNLYELKELKMQIKKCKKNYVKMDKTIILFI